MWQPRAGRIWLRISGYGEASGRPAFGDDAAVAGGLVGTTAALVEVPVFCGDAIADPLTGLEAASAVAESLGRGGGELIHLSMAAVAANYAALPTAAPVSEHPASPPRLPPSSLAGARIGCRQRRRAPAWSPKDAACHADSAGHLAGRHHRRHPGRRADRAGRREPCCRTRGERAGRRRRNRAARPARSPCARALGGLRPGFALGRSARGVHERSTGPDIVESSPGLRRVDPRGRLPRVGRRRVGSRRPRCRATGHSGARPTPQRRLVDPQLRRVGPGRYGRTPRRTSAQHRSRLVRTAAATRYRPGRTESSPDRDRHHRGYRRHTRSRRRRHGVAAGGASTRGIPAAAGLSCRRARKSCATTISTWTR